MSEDRQPMDDDELVELFMDDSMGWFFQEHGQFPGDVHVRSGVLAVKNQVWAELQAENAKLRAEVERLRGLVPGDTTQARVPAKKRTSLNQSLDEVANRLFNMENSRPWDELGDDEKRGYRSQAAAALTVMWRRKGLLRSAPAAEDGTA